MSDQAQVKQSVERYRSLGLVANPFQKLDNTLRPGVEAEIVAEADRLFSAVVASARTAQGRPVRVDKTEDMPPYFHAKAIGEVEHRLIHDDDLCVLHAYTQLYMMRRGRIRPTLSALGERLAFQGVDKTIAAYVEHVLSEPDTELASFQILGDERLAAFAEEFAAAPLETVIACFGEIALERQPALDEVADLRLGNLISDVDEDNEPDEVDADLGTALGTDGLVLGAEESSEEEPVDEKEMIVDYIIEYARVHLSPVIARALRVYKDRGLAAMATEFKVTNAPKKTLAAVIEFARHRYEKIVLIYDGFDSWPSVPQDLRIKIAHTLSEMRWHFADDVVVVIMLDKGLEPELEEAFAAGTVIPWDFPGVVKLQDPASGLDAEDVDRWFAAAARADATPITSGDPTVAALIEAAEGDVGRFIGMARAAVESAAERGAASLDDTALQTGLAAAQEV